MEPQTTPECASSPGAGRRIGRWGTTARLVGGALALAAAAIVGLGGLDMALGLALVPAAMAVLVRARGRDAAPLRLYGPGLCYVLVVPAVAFFVMAPAAAWIFFGASAILAAARGDAGCEILAAPNWLLRRDDQIGCPIFTPIDRWENRVGAVLPKVG